MTTIRAAAEELVDRLNGLDLGPDLVLVAAIARPAPVDMVDAGALAGTVVLGSTRQRREAPGVVEYTWSLVVELRRRADDVQAELLEAACEAIAADLLGQRLAGATVTDVEWDAPQDEAEASQRRVFLCDLVLTLHGWLS